MTDGERVVRWARRLHEMYEETAKLLSWRTQDVCQVPWEELPEPNRRTVLTVVRRFLEELDAENRNSQKVREVNGNE